MRFIVMLAVVVGILLAQPAPALAAGECTPLTYAQWGYLYNKYGPNWGIAVDPVPGNPNVSVAHFLARSKDGRWAFYEGPWIQLRMAAPYADCVQIDNPYWWGPR